MERQSSTTLEASTPLLDSVILDIKHWNFNQILQAILISLSVFFDVFQTYMSIFAHAQPKWHCTRNHNNNTSCVPNKSNLCSLSKSEWAWDNSGYTSIISEWDLECASSLITGLPATSYFMGCLIGGLVLATLGDSSLGRKNLLCVSTLAMSLAALASAFAPNIWVYSVLRFLCGVGRAPLTSCRIVLLSERVGERWRSKSVMAAYIAFSLGILTLTGIAYLSKDSSWRTLYLWTSIPGFVYCIPAYFVINESPRWLLLQRQQEQEAMDVITDLGQPTSSPPTLIRHREQRLSNKNGSNNNNNNNNPFASLKILTSKRWAINRLVTSMLLSFGIGLMYFGMLLGVGDLWSDIYLTSVFHSLLALFSSLLVFLYWIPKCNRRASLLGFCTLGGVTSIVFSIIGQGKLEVVQGPLLGMELLSMFCVCMANYIAMMYMVELFPTCVRSSTTSLVRQAMILGSVFDPILIMVGSRNSILYTYGAFGTALLLCGFLVLNLPETKGKVLCDTLDEQEFMENGESLNN